MASMTSDNWSACMSFKESNADAIRQTVDWSSSLEDVAILRHLNVQSVTQSPFANGQNKINHPLSFDSLPQYGRRGKTHKRLL